MEDVGPLGDRPGGEADTEVHDNPVDGQDDEGLEQAGGQPAHRGTTEMNRESAAMASRGIPQNAISAYIRNVCFVTLTLCGGVTSRTFC